jgi:HD-like signal output (HDOD) protein
MPSVTSAQPAPRSIPMDRILSLPPFPAVARKLLALVARPNFTILEVSHCVRSDAVFSAEVLRLANSAMMGLRYEVVSIMHAISVLGMERLKNVVLTVAMRDFLRGGKQAGMVRLCWRHNLATALAAEELAQACSIEKSDAYTAGLLHDLGRLALVSAYPSEHAAAKECWGFEGEEALAREERHFGINHREAGLLLAEKWGLPSMLREVMSMGSAPRSGPFTVVRLIAVAGGVADRVGFSLSEPSLAWDPEWLHQELPAPAWSQIAPRLDGLQESLLMKINLFESEFLQG